MKSMIVKELKQMGYRKLAGRKLESYSFHQLIGFYTRLKRGEEIK